MVTLKQRQLKVYLRLEHHRCNRPLPCENTLSFSNSLSENVTQYSSEYLNPDQLSPGNTVVVGGGNSGAQTQVANSKIVTTFISNCGR